MNDDDDELDNAFKDLIDIPMEIEDNNESKINKKDKESL